MKSVIICGASSIVVWLVCILFSVNMAEDRIARAIREG